MNVFLRRRTGPLPLIRDISVAEQSARRKREEAWTEKMNRQLDGYLRQQDIAIAKARGEQT